MRTSKHHLGVAFEVWNGHQTWFWFVANPHRESGSIGAAVSESEAVREARLSIEEICDSIISSSWERSLGNLERYLASVCVAAA